MNPIIDATDAVWESFELRQLLSALANSAGCRRCRVARRGGDIERGIGNGTGKGNSGAGSGALLPYCQRKP